MGFWEKGRLIEIGVLYRALLFRVVSIWRLYIYETGVLRQLLEFSREGFLRFWEREFCRGEETIYEETGRGILPEESRGSKYIGGAQGATSV